MSTPFKSEWLQPGAVIPVDIPTLAAFAEELRRVMRENEELRQALETKQEPVAWQPIESALKTGRKVILFYKNRLNVGRTVIARWLTDEQATEIDADDVGLEGGWYECIDNWDDFTEMAIHEGEPSHWMPLPAPPSPKQQERKHETV